MLTAADSGSLCAEYHRALLSGWVFKTTPPLDFSTLTCETGHEECLPLTTVLRVNDKGYGRHWTQHVASAYLIVHTVVDYGLTSAYTATKYEV